MAERADRLLEMVQEGFDACKIKGVTINWGAKGLASGQTDEMKAKGDVFLQDRKSGV